MSLMSHCSTVKLDVLSVAWLLLKLPCIIYKYKMYNLNTVLLQSILVLCLVSD